nr:hypothetical protein [Microvirga roseola]
MDRGAIKSLALALAGLSALSIWSVLTCLICDLVALAGIAGKTQRLKVLDAVSASLANWDDVINCDCRLPALGKRDVRPKPPAAGTMGMLR